MPSNWQAWGVMEFRRGNVNRARELFQEGVWADPDSRDVAYVWQVRNLVTSRVWLCCTACEHAHGDAQVLQRQHVKQNLLTAIPMATLDDMSSQAGSVWANKEFSTFVNP